MKSLLKGILIGIFGLIGLFIAIIILISSMAVDKEETFIPFIEDTLPKITRWEASEFEKLMTDKAFKSITPSQLDLYLKRYKILGKMISFEEAELEGSNSGVTTSEGSITYAVYLVPVVFESGNAHIRLSMQYANDETKINKIDVLSDLLIK